MAASAQLVVSIIGDMKALKTAFADVQKELGGLGSGLKKAGGDLSSAGASMTAGITAPILAAGAGIAVTMNSAVDFDTNMRRVATMLPGLTAEGFNTIKGQALDLSKQFGTSTSEMSNAMYQALSSGVPPDNIFTFMQDAEKLAIGGATDVVTATDVLTNAVNSYGAANLSTAEASDILFQGTKFGKSTVEELAQSLSNVVPIAAAAGISFADVNASLATMTIQGTPTAQATTNLKQLIEELSKNSSVAGQAFQQLTGKTFNDFIAQGGNVGQAIQILQKGLGTTIVDQDKLNKAMKDFENPSSKMSQEFNKLTGQSFQQFQKGGGTIQQALDKMGISYGTTAARMTDYFSSIDAGTGALQLATDGGKLYTQSMEGMNTATGSTKEAFKTMSEGAGQSLKNIKSTLEVFMIQLGDKFLPILEKTLVPLIKDTIIPAMDKLLPVIGSLMEKFAGLSPTIQLVVLGAVGLVAALGPVLVVLGAVSSGIGAIAGLFAAGGAITIAGGIITGLITGIAALGAPILILIGIVALLATAWARDWGGIREKAAAVWDFITTEIEKLRNRLEYTHNAMIMAVATLKTRFNEIWDQISSALSTVWDGITSAFNTFYSAVQAGYNRIIDLAKWLYAQFSGVWDTIKGYLGQALDFIYGLLNTWYNNFQNNCNRIIDVGRTLYNDLARVWDDIENRFNDAKNTVIQYLQNLRNDAETEANNIVNKILNPFSNIKTSLEGFFGDVYDAGKNIVQNLIDGIEDKITDLENEVGKITDKVSKYLPMHSPSKIGALSTLPKWDDIFLNPITQSLEKSRINVERGLGALSGTVSQLTENRYQQNQNTVYEGNSISIGPNTLSNGIDIDKLINEINRRSTAQRRARGLIL